MMVVVMVVTAPARLAMLMSVIACGPCAGHICCRFRRRRLRHAVLS